MRIFQLLRDNEHSVDSERHAVHIPFADDTKMSSVFINEKYREKLPSKVTFEANFGVLSKNDYPVTDLNIPVMSDRMIKILKSAGDVDIHEIPVVMVDDTYQGSSRKLYANSRICISRQFSGLMRLPAIYLLTKR